MLRVLLSGNFTMQEILAQILAVLLVIFLILPFHEWAHAVTALALGDKSIKSRGRLSMNPINHIDPIGALMLLLVGFGWAKPVPIDPRSFKHPKLGMAITAVMGPVANLVAALAGMLVFNLIYYTQPGWLYQSGDFSNSFTLLYYFLTFYVSVNISLAVFNLIPIPPLDGYHILYEFLPYRGKMRLEAMSRYGFIILLILMFAGVFGWVITPLSNGVIRLYDLILSPLAKLIVS